MNVGAAAFTTSLNILSNLMFSKDLSEYYTTSISQEFKDAIWGVMEVGGKPNLVDFFPILRPFDPQGLTRQGNVHADIIYGIFDRIIDQRLQTRESSSTYDSVLSSKKDVLDLLLNLVLKDETEFSRNDMRHLLLVSIFDFQFYKFDFPTVIKFVFT